MTHDFFDGQMRRLGVLRFPPADLSSHREALEDIPAEIFEAAVGHALKTRRDFPVPAELRADADLVAPAVVDTRTDADRVTPLDVPQILTLTHEGVSLRIPVTGEYTYDCEVCSDTGWESLWCGFEAERRAPWLELRNCERRGAHGSHEWARHCRCYDSNPTLISKRAAQQKYASAPQKVA